MVPLPPFPFRQGILCKKRLGLATFAMTVKTFNLLLEGKGTIQGGGWRCLCGSPSMRNGERKEPQRNPARHVALSAPPGPANLPEHPSASRAAFSCLVPGSQQRCPLCSQGCPGSAEAAGGVGILASFPAPGLAGCFPDWR